MEISFESKGGFENVERWLDKVSKTDMSSPLNQIAGQGTRSLSTHTPIGDTGETANSWKGTITKSGDVTEIAWTNNAHPEARVNVAKLIDLGHGTGTGGYVPPRPYIKEAMAPVWDNVDGVIKELIK